VISTKSKGHKMLDQKKTVNTREFAAIKIAKRVKIHLLSNEFTFCGINAVAEGIVTVFDWEFDAECTAICKSCYQVGIEKLGA
jgi:hypothetical protein